MNKPTPRQAGRESGDFFALVKHPLKFRLYMIKNLPAALFCGLRIVSADADACAVSVPFNRLTRNPFKSTYFACLSMAAELSTGVLAAAGAAGRQPRISMLIKDLTGAFYSKAKSTTVFTCRDGQAIRQAIETAIATGVGQQVKVLSTGENSAGVTVAEFWFTWSFKAK